MQSTRYFWHATVTLSGGRMTERHGTITVPENGTQYEAYEEVRRTLAREIGVDTSEFVVTHYYLVPNQL